MMNLYRLLLSQSCKVHDTLARNQNRQSTPGFWCLFFIPYASGKSKLLALKIKTNMTDSNAAIDDVTAVLTN